MTEIPQGSALNQAESGEQQVAKAARINYGVLFGYDEGAYEYKLHEFIQCLHQDYLSNEEFVRILRTFPESMHQKIADDILNGSYRANYLLDNLHFFKNIDFKKLAEELLDGSIGDGFGGGVETDNYEYYFFRNLEKFEGLIDHQEIVDRLLRGEEGEGEYRLLAENLHRLKGVDHEAISQIIVDAKPDMALSNIGNLTGIDHEKLAWRLVDPSDSRKVWFHGRYGEKLMSGLGSLRGLSQKLAEAIVNAEYGYVVAKNLDSFEGLDEEFVEKVVSDYETEFGSDN
jgi:hypothetical protein